MPPEIPPNELPSSTPPPAYIPQPPPEIIPPQHYQQPYIQGQTSGTAIASLVCGIVGTMGCCCCPLQGAALAAVICGHMSLSQIKSNPTLQGKQLAMIGMILGYVTIISYALLMLSSLTNPELYKGIQEAMDKAKQEMQQKQELPKDAT